MGDKFVSMLQMFLSFQVDAVAQGVVIRRDGVKKLRRRYFEMKQFQPTYLSLQVPCGDHAREALQDSAEVGIYIHIFFLFAIIMNAVLSHVKCYFPPFLAEKRYHQRSKIY